MLYNTKKFAGLFNRAQPLTNREDSKSIPVVLSAVHVSVKRMLSKFQTYVSLGTLDREVRMSRSLVLGQESEFLYYNVVITSKQMLLKQLENKKRSCSNQMHNICVLFKNVVRRDIPKSWRKSTIMLHHA